MKVTRRARAPKRLAAVDGIFKCRLRFGGEREGVLSVRALGAHNDRILLAVVVPAELDCLGGAWRVRVRFGAISAENVGNLFKQAWAVMAIDIKDSRGSIGSVELARNPSYICFDIASDADGDETSYQRDDDIFFASPTRETQSH